MTDPTDTTVEITAYSWVPPMARGLVRDLRVRWACEEIGKPYRTRLYDRRVSGPEDRLPEQPFGQVPVMNMGDVQMFESGAACLLLAERSETLMPRDEAGRARALSWSLAALSSVEPFIQTLQFVTLFDRDKPGAAEFAPTMFERVDQRLTMLANALGQREWLEDRFTVGDLLMVTVLRQLQRNGALDKHPTLSAYVARGEERPAFQRALSAQMADFTEQQGA
jgi:glutathione S-transferase